MSRPTSPTNSHLFLSVFVSFTETHCDTPADALNFLELPHRKTGTFIGDFHASRRGSNSEMISRSPAVTSRKGTHTQAFLSNFFFIFYADYPNVIFYPYMCNVVKGHFCVIFAHPICFLSLILILQPKLNCSLQNLWDKERLCVRACVCAPVRVCVRACVRACMCAG